MRLRLDGAVVAGAGDNYLHVPVLAIHKDRALDVAVLEISDDRPAPD